MEKCKWFKKFDGHYSMTCTNENGHRANGNFKPYPFDNMGVQPKTEWDFECCPYCGKKIEVVKMQVE